MKNKNREGSTLVLTLIVFTVLIILGTAILSLMSYENKMSIYHQHKTQAYYLARSGAVAVEAAVMEAYDIDEGKTLNSSVKEVKEEVSLEGLDAIVTIKKVKDGVKTDNTQKYLYIISSEGRSNKIKEVVEKVIPIEITETTKKVVNINNAITYIEEQDEAFEKKNGQKGNKDNYPDYKFAESFSKIDINGTPLTIIEGVINAGNYFVDTSLVKNDGTITVDGEVNIYVRNYVSLKNVNINYTNNVSKLNIYVYGESSLNGESLKVTGGSGNDITIKANFFVKEGSIKFDYHKVEYIGNIVTNGEIVEIVSHANSINHVKLKGIIYAPNGTIKFGETYEEWGALGIKGAIVGKYLRYNPKNNQDKDGKKFTITGDLGGISNPFEDEITITVKKSPGYFK